MKKLVIAAALTTLLFCSAYAQTGAAPSTGPAPQSDNMQKPGGDMGKGSMSKNSKKMKKGSMSKMKKE